MENTLNKIKSSNWTVIGHSKRKTYWIEQELANYGLWTKSGLLIFINKVLL